MVIIKDIQNIIGSQPVYMNELNLSTNEIERAVELGMERICVEEKLTQREMCTQAVEQLLNKNGVAAKEIDIIIYATGLKKDFAEWCGAAYIQHECKLVNAFAFDVFQGCNSLLQGIMIANNFIKADNRINKVIVSGSDKFYRAIPHGSLSGIIGGAGSTAVLIENDDDGLQICDSFNLTDGRFANFTYSLGGSESRVSESILTEESDLYKVRNFELKEDVGRVSLENYLNTIGSILERSCLHVTDIRYYIFPNTNKSLYISIMENLGISKQQLFLDNIPVYGHMGCVDFAINFASIKANLLDDEYILANSMGVGLSWIAVLFKWN